MVTRIVIWTIAVVLMGAASLRVPNSWSAITAGPSVKFCFVEEMA
jgi:hypothetical protein